MSREHPVDPLEKKKKRNLLACINFNISQDTIPK